MIEQFKQLVSKLIQTEQIQLLNQLLQKMSLLREDYDAEMCCLTARACLLNQLIPTALAWAERGMQLDPEYEPNKELLEQILQMPVDPRAYQPFFRTDCTMLNRVLKIVIFRMDYAIFRYTIEQFRKAWEFLGHQVFVYDCEKINESALAMVSFLENKYPDMLFSINNAYWKYHAVFPFSFHNGDSICNINFLFDNPIFYKDYLNIKKGNAVTTCVDQNHVSFIKNYYHDPKALFLPLGGQELPIKAIKNWMDRKIDVLYVGSVKLSMNECMEKPFYNLVVNYMLQHLSCPSEIAIEECFKQLSDEQYAECFPQLALQKKHSEVNESDMCQIIHTYSPVDTNINSVYRISAVAMLVNAGIHVTVYGNDVWSEVDFERPDCFHFMGAATPWNSVELMGDSKIVLNSLPWFKDGTHDRVVNAMLNGAVALTDPSNYLLERYVDGEDVLYYHLDHLEQLPKIVFSILQDPDRAESITNNVYRKAFLFETWQNRAMQLLEQTIFEDRALEIVKECEEGGENG